VEQLPLFWHSTIESANTLIYSTFRSSRERLISVGVAQIPTGDETATIGVVRREFSAGGVVVRRMRGRWWAALVRPRRDPHRPQVWALPKGQIDAGERAPETAVREVFEETGVQARIERKLGDSRYVYTWDGERIFKVVSFFLLAAKGGRIGELPPGMEIEVAEARWVPLDDAPRLLSYGGEKQIARAAIEVLTEEGFH
jgi:8-oxo-dGTP pyrophosphatase MutT (NUDIX family)